MKHPSINRIRINDANVCGTVYKHTPDHSALIEGAVEDVVIGISTETQTSNTEHTTLCVWY